MEQQVQRKTRRPRSDKKAPEAIRCAIVFGRVTAAVKAYIDAEIAAQNSSMSEYVGGVLTKIAAGARQPPPLLPTTADAGD